MGERMLDGKVVLVVGASAGIGADAARVLARHGAEVMLVARRERELHELVTELRDSGFTADYRVGDITIASDVARVVHATVDSFGQLDGAINSAAMTHAGQLDEVTEQDFDRIVAVNLKGMWLCMRAQLSVMRQQKSGSIVNISSVSGTRGGSGLGAYNATKHAVIGLTRTSSHDVGPLGIRVNALAPGPTETPMLSATRAAIPGGVEARIAATPLRKPGSGAEVAEAAAWLISDYAAHVSGIVLPVDGGLSA